jgi:hypothetical protein
MNDGVLVEAPLVFPSACIGCGSQKGPIFDSRKEIPGGGRVYVCKNCFRVMAKAWGVVKGERMEQLLDAAAGLEQAETEKRLKDEVIERLRKEKSGLKRALGQTETERDEARAELATERSKLERIDETIGAMVGQKIEP